jgi:flavin reductase (DIM6/NTAB) family NADH-FMN oxidoreductase RutF
MLIDPEQASIRDVHSYMVSLITPRPIAWVATVSAAGEMNLAPFSYFNGVGANPPTLMFCPANRRDGSPKDTLANVEQTRQFTVNLVSFAQAEAMNQTSADYDSRVSEFATCGVVGTPSVKVGPPRVKDSLASFECELLQVLKLGSGPAGANVVIGQIVLLHVADEVLDANGRVNAAKLDTIGRLGGQAYLRTTDRFELERPSI